MLVASRMTKRRRGIDRARLRPASQVGVVASWLVIAPLGSPVTRLDLRALDVVEASADGLRLVRGDCEVELAIADAARSIERLVHQVDHVIRYGERSVDEPQSPGSSLLFRLTIIELTREGDRIRIGRSLFEMADSSARALRGEVLLVASHPIQAAMVMLVVG